MLKEELLSILPALGEIQSGLKDENLVSLMRVCRRNLKAAAELAETLEKNLTVEPIEEAI